MSPNNGKQNGNGHSNGHNNGNGNGYQRPSDFTSPWTFAFQSSPVHTNSDYSNGKPHHDDTQLPTLQALTDIYDPTQRL